MPYDTPLEYVIQCLSSRGCNPRRNGSGYTAKCPSHDDHKPSLTIGAGADGRVLLNCHAGCSLDDICNVLGLQPRDLFHKPASSGANRDGWDSLQELSSWLLAKTGAHDVTVYQYRLSTGSPAGAAIRLDFNDGRKDIRQARYEHNRWFMRAMPVPRPLYNLPNIISSASSDFIFVVEGEKCADALSHLGLIATTSAGGAKGAKHSDWSPLRGRRCVLLPDNDNAGIGYIQDVAQLISSSGGETRTIKLWEFCSNLPSGGDVADVLSDPDWCGLQLGDGATPADFARWLQQQAEALFTGQHDEAELDETDRELIEREPFPIDALPDVLRDYVASVSSAIGCDPSFVALPVLVACGAAIGNTKELVIKQGWSVPAILWGVLVGESGTCKSPALRAVRKAVDAVQRKSIDDYAKRLKEYEEREGNQADDEADEVEPAETGKVEPSDESAGKSHNKNRQPPSLARQIVSDATLEALCDLLSRNPRGLLLYRDELAGWFENFDRYARNGRGDEPQWLSIYNADQIIVDRKTGEKKTIIIPRAAVSVVGGIQPNTLKQVLTRKRRENGLAARLLMVYPPRKPRRWTDAEVDRDIERRFGELVDKLYKYPYMGGPVAVGLSEDAKRAFIEFYDANAQEQSELDGELCSAWSKLEELAARLALVLHTIEHAGDGRASLDATQPAEEPADFHLIMYRAAELWPVTAETMRQAIRLTEWFKAEAKRVYALLGESDAEGSDRKLVEFLQRRGGSATAREVRQGCRWLKQPGKAEEALDNLANRNLGHWEADNLAGQRGRPTRRFVLKLADKLSTKMPVSNPTCLRNYQKPSEKLNFVDSRRVDANCNVDCDSRQDAPQEVTEAHQYQPADTGTSVHHAERPAGQGDDLNAEDWSGVI